MNWLSVLLGEDAAEASATENTKKLAAALKLVAEDEDRGALADWITAQHERAKGRKKTGKL